MRCIALPWLSARLDRPAVALVAPLLDLSPDPIPDGAAVVSTRVPSHLPAALMPALRSGPILDEPGQPTALEADLEWERWLDRLLSESLGEPALASRLGPDRPLLAVGLLRAWGWLPEEDGTVGPRLSAVYRRALATVASQTGRLPSELIAGSFAALAFDHAILADAEAQKARGILG